MRKSADQALPSLSRRTFVAAAATTGAAAALGLSGCSPKADTEAGAGADAEGAALDPYADAELGVANLKLIVDLTLINI